MNTDRNYYKKNEKIGESKYDKKRVCKYCKGILVWYDCEDGIDLFMCDNCNAQDVIENGKRKFVSLF